MKLWNGLLQTYFSIVSVFDSDYKTGDVREQPENATDMPMEIPKSLLEQLNKANNQHELLKTMNVTMPDHLLLVVPGQSLFVGHPQIAVKELTTLSNYTIENPMKGRGRCVPVSHCVPLPILHDGPGFYQFPDCIDLPQCTGSCCIKETPCAVDTMVSVTVKVMIFKYQHNNNFAKVGTHYVTLSHHKTCKCARN